MRRLKGNARTRRISRNAMTRQGVVFGYQENMNEQWFLQSACQKQDLVTVELFFFLLLSRLHTTPGLCGHMFDLLEELSEALVGKKRKHFISSAKLIPTLLDLP